MLDRVLVDAAAAAGADVRYGVTVTDVRRDRHGRVTGILGRDGSGRRSPSTHRSSSVPTACARPWHDTSRAPVERRGAGASAVTTATGPIVDTNGYEWIFRPDACAGVIPTNGGLACVFAAASPRRVGRGGPSVLLSVLTEACPETAARVQAGDVPTGVRTFTGHPGFMRRAWGHGWALVGDAGYWKDPLSAHGLTDALRDAELLARAVLASASGEVGEAEAFDRYQAHPRPTVDAVVPDHRRDRRAALDRCDDRRAADPAQCRHGR